MLKPITLAMFRAAKSFSKNSCCDIIKIYEYGIKLISEIVQTMSCYLTQRIWSDIE
jgi:hypothetical protein